MTIGQQQKEDVLLNTNNMRMQLYTEEPPPYSEYKAKWFEKKRQKAKSLRTSIKESSLREQDKKELIEICIKELKGE